MKAHYERSRVPLAVGECANFLNGKTLPINVLWAVSESESMTVNAFKHSAGGAIQAESFLKHRYRINV